MLQISRLMSLNDVEFRKLASLKQLMINQKNDEVINLSLDKLKNELTNIFAGYKDSTLIVNKLIEWLAPGELKSVSFDRVNTVVDFL